ncbi:MAG: AMP-binding protein [Streptosporangiaceae bacterium]
MAEVRPPARATNLTEMLARRAAEGGFEGRPAFWSGDRVHIHGEVHEDVARAAGLLREVGARPGDRVLIALPDQIEFVWAFLGAVRLGAVAVPVNPMLAPDEHAYMLADAGPAVVVCTADLAPRFGSARVLAAEELGDRLAKAEPAPAAEITADTPAYAQYTSGTTGQPKGALHRHADAAAYFEAMGVHALGLRPEDVSLSVSKAYFAYGLGNTVFFPLFSGSSAVLFADKPSVPGVVEAAARYRPTVFYGVPTFYAGLVADGDPAAFAGVRAGVSAGEALLPAFQERAESWLGCPVLDGLGSTEVGQTFISNTLERRRPGTIGVVLPPYEAEARDGDGAPVRPGEEGVLHIRGPSVLLGYLNKPEATAEVLVGGWLRSGDLASLDADGFVHHHGRADDMEMVGGITMSPLEVERLLATHDAVSEIAVAVVRDAGGASRLRAFVVPASTGLASAGPGRSSRPDLERELTDLARHHLAAYKVPRSVAFVDALPRTPTGKLRRYILREGRVG